MNFFILIAGTAFAIVWRALDINITLKAKREGIGREETGIVATKGQLSLWKGVAIVAVILAAAWVAYFTMGEYTPEYKFVPGIIAALGGVASMVAYYSNKKNIRNRRAKRNIPGGIV